LFKKPAEGLVHAGFRLLDRYLFLQAILLMVIVETPAAQILFGCCLVFNAS